MMISNEYRMLMQEGHLASTSLLAGFESLCKLDYDKPGSVYSTLFQLTTGLERIMKIAVILEHKANNNLASPSDARLKRLGHSITDLYSVVRQASQQRSINGGWFDHDTIQGEILATLSEFARCSRYYNIDRLVGGQQSADPLTRWFAIHMEIAEDSVSIRRRHKIMEAARRHCEALGQLGWEMGPRGQWDLTIDVTYQMQIANASCGHFFWIIIEILELIYRLIDQLVDEIHGIETAQGIEVQTVPFMVEFFPFCLVDEKFAITRKAWTSLFYIAGRI